MMNQADSIVPESMATAQPPAVRQLGDRVFKWLTLLMALSVFALVVLIGFELWRGSHLALQKFGWRFLSGSTWDPLSEQLAALPRIFGTRVSSAVARVIAVPLRLACDACPTERAAPWC